MAGPHGQLGSNSIANNTNLSSQPGILSKKRVQRKLVERLWTSGQQNLSARFLSHLKRVGNKNNNRNKNMYKIISDFLNGPLCPYMVIYCYLYFSWTKKYHTNTFLDMGIRNLVRDHLKNLLIKLKILNIAVYFYFQNPWGFFPSAARVGSIFPDTLYHVLPQEIEKQSGQNMWTGCPQLLD